MGTMKNCITLYKDYKIVWDRGFTPIPYIVYNKKTTKSKEKYNDRKTQLLDLSYMQ